MNAPKSFFILTLLTLVMSYSCKKVETNKEEEYDANPEAVSVIAIATYDNTVWGGSSLNGLFKFDGESWLNYNQTDGLINDTITCLLLDNEGCLWIGTSKGISTFNNDVWTTITTADGLYNNDIRSLACDPQNNIWIGTRNNRLVKFDGTDFTSYHVNPELSGPEEMGHIHSIACDTEGNIWVGSCISGLSKFDGTIWTDEINNLKTFVEPLLCTVDGDVWVGHLANGAYRFSGTEWFYFSETDGLIGDMVYCFTIDQQKNIWIGTDSGLSKYDGESFTSYTTNDGLPDDNINALACDEDNNMWVGTSKGLVKLTLE